jgi:UDP-hydrolysing UDP-N-acetyl-D-glucosamine 2-epimerase
MTYHPETKRTVEYNLSNVKYCLEAILEKEDYQTVVTYANMDFGGQQINSYIEEFASKYPKYIKVVPSLGQSRYLSFMKQAKFVIGNSSSGIVEAPFLNISVVNIGDRQKGRYRCGNVVQCNGDKDSIYKAVHNIDKINTNDRNDRDYWGDGHTSERILYILENEIV